MSVPNPISQRPKRIDLHCHSRASTEADEAVLLKMRCPESYSLPRQVRAQALSRGMDFVTITDHDAIAGALEIAHEEDVIIGEEVTCWFPEDHCKMHVLVWGITAGEHEALQAMADDIYRVARFIAQHRIAHAVAHPLYRQNAKLQRWHMERLVLLFKGFECLNGAHSLLHQEALEPMLDALDEREIERLRHVHGIDPLWPRPWIKSRTAGSDDHGLFNVGRTWTEFPADTTTVAQLLDCLREGRCRPGGEAGSSLKLAHAFLGVGLRYYTHQLTRRKATKSILERIVGDRPGKVAMARDIVRHVPGMILGKAARVFRPRRRRGGTDLLAQLLSKSARQRWSSHPALGQALRDGRALLAEHEPMFEFLSDVNRDIVQGIGAWASESLEAGKVNELFDVISTVAAHQALLLPYYFALFHQNQERHMLAALTGRPRRMERGTLRVGVFTDAWQAGDPAGRFAQALARFAGQQQLSLVVHTRGDAVDAPGLSVRNFQPHLRQRVGPLDLVVPPVLEMLEWSDRQQFDVIVANTCGPVGLCGWLSARMLRVPIVAAYHHDLPAQVFAMTHGDYRTTAAVRGCARWFYQQGQRVLARSRAGREAAQRLGLLQDCVVLPPSHDAQRDPVADREACWIRHGITQPLRVVCTADAADMAIVAGAWEHVRRRRDDVALVIAGPGVSMPEALKRTPGVYVLDVPAAEADTIFGSCDLLLHPGHNDLCAQAAIDAQSMGVPAVVGAAGAPAEFIDDDLTGRVITGDDPAIWGRAVLELLADETRRQRLARTGPTRVPRFNTGACYEALWEQCLQAAVQDIDHRAGRGTAIRHHADLAEATIP